eukprot:13128965-Heterocapsa_arctica.AAC.1
MIAWATPSRGRAPCAAGPAGELAASAACEPTEFGVRSKNPGLRPYNRRGARYLPPGAAGRPGGAS